MSSRTWLSLLCLLATLAYGCCSGAEKENATHCEDEPMVYTHTTRMDLLYPLLYRTGLEQNLTDPSILANMTPAHVMHGRRFPCLPNLFTLQRYHLTSEYKLGEAKPANASAILLPPAPRYVLVSAVDASFYPALRVAIHSVQLHFPAAPGSYKFIVYDLDGELRRPENSKMLGELEHICHLEVRDFNSSERLLSMDSDLLDRHSFAWKVHVIAEVFRDLDAENELLIWLDSAIRFRSSVYEFGPLYFNAMNGSTSAADGGKRMAPVQMGGPAAHSIQWATHPTMYTWLPMDPLLGNLTMREANFMVFRKTEASRQLLKWAVLCATTRECIVPTGQRLQCNVGVDPDAECHRQDQSLMNILIGNMEMDWWNGARFAGEKERQSFRPLIIGDYVRANSKCDGDWCNGGGGHPNFAVERRSTNPKLFISWCGGGELRNNQTGVCIDSSVLGENAVGREVVGYPCHRLGGNQYWILMNNEIRRGQMCLDYDQSGDAHVMVWECHGEEGNQKWVYDDKIQQLYHEKSQLCLELNDNKAKLQMARCDVKNTRQMWKFGLHNQ